MPATAQPKTYITPLEIDGMHGRVLRVPAARPASKGHLLLVYGHHASLERIFGIAEDLSKYATVTAPDLPGFGGMDTFYAIGKQPTLDNLADYLATFVAQTYSPRQKVTIAGMSLGFAIVTRMLQRHPELQGRVGTVVSMVGLVHKDDFKFTPFWTVFWKTVGVLGSTRPGAWLCRHVLFTGPVVRATYALVADHHVKMKDANAAERRRRIAFEIVLWRCNDPRTYFATGLSLLRLDLRGVRLPMPVYHTAVQNDRYFNNAEVEKHLREIFDIVHIIYSDMREGHAPTVIADAKAAAELLPGELRKLLANGIIV